MPGPGPIAPPGSGPFAARLDILAAIGALAERLRSAGSRIPRQWRSRIRRFARYAVGSLVASLISAAALALVYRAGAGPRIATIVAFCAGAAVNFAIFRFWAWRDTAGRIGHDLARFAVVAVGTALIALGTTSLADGYARDAGLDETVRTLVVEGSYFGAFAAMFVVKFVVLDRFVFNRRDRSRDQVDTTRA
jgi:putative flippase GtrA